MRQKSPEITFNFPSTSLPTYLQLYHLLPPTSIKLDERPSRSFVYCITSPQLCSWKYPFFLLIMTFHFSSRSLLLTSNMNISYFSKRNLFICICLLLLLYCSALYSKRPQKSVHPGCFLTPPPLCIVFHCWNEENRLKYVQGIKNKIQARAFHHSV